MSVFNGMTGVLTAVFGASGTITPPSGAPVTITAIVREVQDFVSDGDQRLHRLPMYLLHVRKPVPAALVRGATVSGFGRTEQFKVLDVYPDRSPASDAFMIAELEVKP